jgi:hypothetical protein
MGSPSVSAGSQTPGTSSGFGSSHGISDQSKFSMKSFSPNASIGSQTPGPSGIRKSSNNPKLGTPQMFRSGSSSTSDNLMVQRQSHNQTGISDDLHKLNMSINSQRLANEQKRQAMMSQQQQQHDPRGSGGSQATNIFREARKNLLDNTLRNMQNASQKKFQNFQRSMK